MKRVVFTVFVMLFMRLEVFAQSATVGSDRALIEETLMDYIEGTANGQPERLRKAFHPDFCLYSVAQDTLRIWKGQDYIGNIEEGEKANRIGRIVFIDIAQDAATAKVEIVMPDRQRIYTDYFLLLKYRGAWKIIHKSFSWREMAKN